MFAHCYLVLFKKSLQHIEIALETFQSCFVFIFTILKQQVFIIRFLCHFKYSIVYRSLDHIYDVADIWQQKAAFQRWSDILIYQTWISWIVFSQEVIHCKKSIVQLSDSSPNLFLIYPEITWALSTQLEHIHKKFEINWTTIKGIAVSHEEKWYPAILRVICL